MVRSTSTASKILVENESLKKRIKELEDQLKTNSVDGDGKPQLSVTYSTDVGHILYVGTQVLGPQELLRHAKIDESIWEVAEVKVNNWEVAGKRKRGQGDGGKWKEEEIWKTGLRQVSVKLRRKAPKLIQDGIRGILDDVPSWRKSLPTPKVRYSRKGDHLLELSLYDVHLGKLCWGAETQYNYDLKIAAADYRGAVEDMFERVKGFAIEKIVIPVGNDFFNVDNWAKTTAKGTPVDSTDDRFTKVFQVGYDCIQDAVIACRDVAPVELIWVPGNHDPATSWYLCEMLRKVFDKDKRVTVDNSLNTRKYQLYGISLIGWNHSDNVSFEKLASLMPIEVPPQMWSASVYRHIRVGHWHKKKQVRHVNRDTFHGVDVTAIPSLSVTDKWHYDQGYVGNLRTAETAIWSFETGYVGSFSVEARSAVARRKVADGNQP